MQYHIDTIPVIDAFEHADGQCPLCFLQYKNEHLLCDRFLGASVMEPATRIAVNEKGFCKKHHRMLYEKQNRLGHALMMQSHLIELKKKLEKGFSSADEDSGFFFLKKKNSSSILPALDEACIICDNLEENSKRYQYTCLHLLLKNASFKGLFQASALCLHDLIALHSMAKQEYNSSESKTLCTLIQEKAFDSIRVLEKDIDWFTKKFDYKNQDKPWGNSKTAVERCMNFLRGHSIISEKSE